MITIMICDVLSIACICDVTQCACAHQCSVLSLAASCENEGGYGKEKALKPRMVRDHLIELVPKIIYIHSMYVMGNKYIFTYALFYIF